MTARYPFPWDLFVSLARDLPAGRRSLRDDSALLVSRIEPAPLVLGEDHIPGNGPLVVAPNHYQRRGLWIGWPGASITLAVAQRRGDDPPLRWLVTGGLRLFQWRGDGPSVPGSEAVFRAVGRIYGMAALPLSGTSRRATVIRRWVRWAEEGQVLGVFPEGILGRSEGLRPPDRSFPTLLEILHSRHIPVVPAGIHEEGERLTIRFGPPLKAPDADSLMWAIAALLPPELRGPYRAVEASRGAME